MKIISKFKDFYDYKVAKYGIDEKLVYIRKTYCEYFQVLIGNIKKKLLLKMGRSLIFTVDLERIGSIYYLIIEKN